MTQTKPHKEPQQTDNQPIKCLPPANIITNEDQCSYDILNMCASPSYSKGKKAMLINHDNWNTPCHGVVRAFNPLDYLHLYKEYTMMLGWDLMKLPDMNKVYDFFPANSDGKGISVHHTHISRDQFVYTDNKKNSNQLILTF